MVDAAIEQEISAYLGQLPITQQQNVLEYVRLLAGSKVQGVPGSALLRFGGAIDEIDLDMMSQAIESGCEGVDVDILWNTRVKKRK